MGARKGADIEKGAKVEGLGESKVQILGASGVMVELASRPASDASPHDKKMQGVIEAVEHGVAKLGDVFFGIAHELLAA